MSSLFDQRSGRDNDSEWISVSDLMAGLMVIFLFIAIVYIRPLVETKERALREKEQLAQVQSRIREIAVTWQKTEIAIYRALLAEFKGDLPRWNAEIERDTLVVRFNAPDILFDQGIADLKPRFKNIIADFFPRYLRVLSKFRPVIEEIRIEGHTSSRWNASTPADTAYFNNMALSQERTRAVLEYALLLPAVLPWKAWARGNVTANGLSSSRLIANSDGTENFSASRRVEFRVRTRVQSEILKILMAVQ